MFLKFWSTWLDSNQRLEGFADLWLNHSPTRAFLRKTFVIAFNKLRIELKFCCKFSLAGTEGVEPSPLDFQSNAP